MMRKLMFLVLVFYIGLLFTGCNDNSEFKSAYEQFWDSYYKATSFYELDEDRFEALKKMDPDIVETELNNMKKVLDVLSNKMETEREKSTYADLEIVYNDLSYLFNVHNNIDGLDDDEKMDVENKLVEVSIYRDSLKKGEGK